jgi:CheY-like chemotaxis protein
MEQHMAKNLIIDHDAGVREMMNVVLTCGGHTVTEAGS